MAALTVELKNPPAGATGWELSITDWNASAVLHWGISVPGNILEVASFDVPESWTPAYRVVALQVMYPTPGNPAARTVLYYMQSWRPFLWDWDLWDWSTEPDPTFRNSFIPGAGDYFFNVATEEFELKALPAVSITVPDSAEEGSLVSVTGVLTNPDPDYGYQFRTQVWESSTLIETWEETIYAGQSKTYQTSFTMPGRVAHPMVWVERRSGTNWNFVGAAAKDVALSVAPPAAEFRNFGVAEYTRV